MSFPLHPEPRRLLEGLLDTCRALGPRAVMAFDLDSTLFDNRPRQVAILKEYGEKVGHAKLIANQVDHWVSGWDMKGAMHNAGLASAEIELHGDPAKDFWRDRFFTSPYAALDIDIPGAPAFLEKVKSTGAVIAYLTGRHEAMRDGSVDAMRKTGMALPDGRSVQLLMKPTLTEDDDAFKERAFAQLRTIGTVVAGFDNEPTHANSYRRAFPEATTVHLATDHSGRPVPLLAGIVSIPHFAVF